MSKKEVQLAERMSDSEDVIAKDVKIPRHHEDEVDPKDELIKAYSEALTQADEERRKAGMFLGVVSFAAAIMAVSFVLYKTFVLLGSNELTKAFIETKYPGAREYRLDMLTYLGIIVAAQSAVTIWLIVWCGRMIRVAIELYIPINHLNQKKGTFKFSPNTIKSFEKFLKSFEREKED